MNLKHCKDDIHKPAIPCCKFLRPQWCTDIQQDSDLFCHAGVPQVAEQAPGPGSPPPPPPPPPTPQSQVPGIPSFTILHFAYDSQAGGAKVR